MQWLIEYFQRITALVCLENYGSRNYLDISRNYLDTSRNYLDTSRNFLDTSRNQMDMSNPFHLHYAHYLELLI